VISGRFGTVLRRADACGPSSVVSGTSYSSAGLVHVFSGATGSTLVNPVVSPNAQTNGHFGIAIAESFDAGASNRIDFFVGAPQENPTGSPTNAGRVYGFDFVPLCTVSCVCKADLNGDGVVNTVDLTAFLGLYGQTCPAEEPARSVVAGV